MHVNGLLVHDYYYTLFQKEHFSQFDQFIWMGVWILIFPIPKRMHSEIYYLLNLLLLLFNNQIKIYAIFILYEGLGEIVGCLVAGFQYNFIYIEYNKIIKKVEKTIFQIIIAIRDDTWCLIFLTDTCCKMLPPFNSMSL